MIQERIAELKIKEKAVQTAKKSNLPIPQRIELD